MELKIVTFNIRCDYGQDGPNQFCYRSGLVKRKIEAEQPDIICFQEVLPHVVQWLKENLTDYYVVGCGREKTLDGEQMTVAFRRERLNMISMETYWMSPEPNIPGSRYEEQSMCPRTCTELVLQDVESIKPFRLINTHLDHIGVGARKLGLEQIVKKIESETFLPEVPVILAGDFNAEPDGEEIRVLDGKVCVNLTEGIGITFHGFDGSEPEQTIDYIYLFPQQASYTLKKLEKWEDKEGEVWLSDHYPVCVVLELE